MVISHLREASEYRKTVRFPHFSKGKNKHIHNIFHAFVEVKPWAQNQPSIIINIKEAPQRSPEAGPDEALRGYDHPLLPTILRIHGDTSAEEEE